jgi:hypothetical protein
MGSARSTHRKMNAYRVFGGKVVKEMILRWVFNKDVEVICTGFIRLKIETSGEILWTQERTFELHKRMGNL